MSLCDCFYDEDIKSEENTEILQHITEFDGKTKENKVIEFYVL